MKYFQLLLLALTVTLQATAQTVKTDSFPPPPPPAWNDNNNENGNKIFDMVEVEATFPGGVGKWRDYLASTLNAAIPVENGAPAGKYTVIVQFIVDKLGKISDVRALTSHGFGMEKEVIRVIKNGPDWEPAVQNGRVVKAYRRQPVTFEVIEEKRKKKNKG